MNIIDVDFSNARTGYVTSDEAEAEIWLQEQYLNHATYLLILKNLPPIHQNGELDFY